MEKSATNPSSGMFEHDVRSMFSGGKSKKYILMHADSDKNASAVKWDLSCNLYFPHQTNGKTFWTLIDHISRTALRLWVKYLKIFPLQKYMNHLDFRREYWNLRGHFKDALKGVSKAMPSQILCHEMFWFFVLFISRGARVSFGLCILKVKGPTLNLQILNARVVLITVWGPTFLNQWEYMQYTWRRTCFCWQKNPGGFGRPPINLVP